MKQVRITEKIAYSGVTKKITYMIDVKTIIDGYEFWKTLTFANTKEEAENIKAKLEARI